MAKTSNTVSVSSKSSKTSNNTPVNAFEAYVGKLNTMQQKAMRAIHAEKQAKQAKQAKKEETKKGIFSLVAGTIVKIEHKMLKKAIDYHCKQGNLAKVETGVKLTAQGADGWNKNRVLANPEGFQKIAAFVNGGANLPEFGGERKTPVKIAANKQLPSLEFWGSFATANMRLCFASIWASK